MKKTLHTVLTAAAFAVSMNNVSIIPTGAAETQDNDNPIFDVYDPTDDIPSTVYGPPSWFGDIDDVEDIITTTDIQVYPEYGVISPEEKTTAVTEEIIKTTATRTYPAYGTINPDSTTTSLTEELIKTTTMMTYTMYGIMSPETTTSSVTEDILKTTATMTYPVYGPAQYYYGDYNYDWSTDSLDLTHLKSQILENTQDNQYDFNRDGEIGIADLIALQNFILGRGTTTETADNSTTFDKPRAED